MKPNQPTIILICITIVLAIVPSAHAQLAVPANGSEVNCHPFPVAAVATVIVVGNILLCVDVPKHAAQLGDRTTILAQLTTPTLLAASTATITLLINPFNNDPRPCAVTSGDLLPTTTAAGGVFIRGWQITQTYRTCTGLVQADLTLGGVSYYSGAVAFTITTDDVVVFDDPNGWNINCTTGCNATVNVDAGDVNIAPANVSVGDVNIAPANITVLANTTVIVNATGNQTTEKHFDGSLYVLLTAVGLALAHIGATNRTYGPRGVGGVFMFAGGLAIFRELDRLGFSHMEASTIGMAAFVIVLQWIASVILLTPADEEKETEEAQ